MGYVKIKVRNIHGRELVAEIEINGVDEEECNYWKEN